MTNPTRRLPGAAYVVLAGLVLAGAAHGQLPIIAYDNPDVGFENPDNELHVYQHEDRAILDWESFSIGADNKVVFHQSPDMAILNRVIGDARSELLGELHADGTVWLINPNGVLIGDGALIQTQSFIASTLNINDDVFLNSDVEAVTFAGDSGASIINHGVIEAFDGDVVLLARHVDNQGGIHASQGDALLAAGNEVEVILQPSHPLNHRIAVKSVLGGETGATGVNHDGVIQAAKAELAAAGGNVYSLAVNVGGHIQADGHPGGGDYQAGSIHLTTDGGRIRIDNGAELVADAGIIGAEAGTGEITIAGRVDARSSSAENWGQIQANAQRIEILAGAELDAGNASGEAGVITLEKARDDSDGRVVIHEGASLLAEGDHGWIDLDSGEVRIAGTLAASHIDVDGDARVTIDAPARVSGNVIDVRSDAEVSVAGQLTSQTAVDTPGPSERIDLSASRVVIASDAVISAGEYARIDINGDRGMPANELIVEEGARLQVGNRGVITLIARDQSLAGDLRAADGDVYLGADSVQAAAATIEAARLGLFGVREADISGADNAIAELLLKPSQDGLVPMAMPMATLEPGDLVVNSGRGTLDVIREGLLQFRNLTLTSEGDLTLDEYFDIDVTERAVLASLEGRLVNGSVLPLFENAEYIRLYARQESDLGGLVADQTGSAVFPDDPDPLSRAVFYRIIDPPEPEPEPDPEQGTGPHHDVGENQNRDSAHQQQHALPHGPWTRHIDPTTGNTSLWYGSGTVSTTDQPPESPPGFGPGSGFPNLGHDVDRSVLRQLLDARKRIDAENSEFLDQGQDSSDQYREQLQSRIDELLRQAMERGQVDQEAITRLIEEVNDRFRDQDGDAPSPPPSAGDHRNLDDRRGDIEQQRRDQLERLRQQREQQMREEQRKRQQAERKNQALLERLQQQKRELGEQNQRAQEERRQQAEDRLKEQLTEQQQQRLEQRAQQRRDQMEQRRNAEDRQAPAAGTWQSSPLPSPVNMGGR